MLKSIYHFFHTHYHRRYHGIYKHAKQLFIFDLILLAGAVALLFTSIFLFIWKPSIARQIEINISLGDDRLKSGQAVAINVHYVNHSKVSLQKPVLALRLPIGFVQTTNTPNEPNLGDNHTVVLSPVAPGAEGTLTVHGILWTEPQKEDRITATLSFERSDNHTTEQSIASYLVNLPESVLKASLDVRTSTFPGQPLTFTYSLTNTSNEALGNINITTISPVTFAGHPDLQHILLQPNETKKLTGTVQVPAKTGTIILEFTPRFSINGHELVQSTARDSKTIAVFYPSTNSSIRWKNQAPNYIESNSTQTLTVQWKNTSSFTLTRQRIRIDFSPRIVDLKRTAKENNLLVDGDSLIANSSNRTALADGKPSSNGSFDITLYFLPTFGTINSNRFEVSPHFEAQINEIPDVFFSHPGSVETAPLATNLILSEQVRYYTNEGDQLGRGPLPPVVGETTKYWVMIEITNTTNDVRDVNFLATLAPGAVFTGKQSVTIGPELSTNKSTVSWNYKKLPAHSTTGLYFEVSVTPAASDLGRKLSLVTGSRLTATDDAVGKQFSLAHGLLTNVLPASDQGSDSGADVAAQ